MRFMKLTLTGICILLTYFGTIGQIRSQSWETVVSVAKFNNFKKSGFVIYDTTSNIILKNGGTLSSFSLFNDLSNRKIKEQLSINQPVVSRFNDEILNIDSILNYSTKKLVDYDLFKEIKTLIYDSTHIVLSDYENQELDLNELVVFLVLKKHNGIHYESGITFSDIVYYGDYGFQLVKQYWLLKSSSNPVYYNLIVFKKGRKGKYKVVEVVSSDPMI